jgi:hypothetical protein
MSKDVRQLTQYQLGAPANVNELNDDINALDAAPTLATDGLSCKEIGAVDLIANFGAVSESVTVEIWLYDGAKWVAPQAAITIAAITGNDTAYVLGVPTGSMNRIYARVTTGATSAGTLDMTPVGEP